MEGDYYFPIDGEHLAALISRLPVLNREICRAIASSMDIDGNEVLRKSPMALSVEISPF